MKRIVLYVLVFILVVAVSGGAFVSCSKKTETPATKSSSQPSSTAPAPTNSGATPASPSSGTTATPPASSSQSGPAGMPDIVDMKSLSSYRFSVMTKVSEGAGAGTESTMKYEWVRDQQAEHVWMEGPGNQVTELYIRIGDKGWMYVPGMGWMEQPPQASAQTQEASDLASQLKDATNYRFDKKGSETVNGVKCNKYEFEYDVTMEMPDMATGGTSQSKVHASGTMWVADQSGVPEVVIKSVGTSQVESGNTNMVMEYEQNLTDINTNISIEPPETSMQIPGLPTNIPTSLPTDIPNIP